MYYIKKKIISTTIFFLLISSLIPSAGSFVNIEISSNASNNSSINMIGNWIEQQNLLSIDYPAGAEWRSDSLDGDKAVIGTFRYFYVYIRESKNLPPIALFVYTPSFPTDLDIVQFIDASTDDGTIVSWHWNFDDGTTSPLQNPVHQYADDGSYFVNLTVTDDNGISDSISQLVVVSNVAPEADADGPYAGSTTHVIHLDGSGSYDADGTLIAYQWDFGDGKTGAGKNTLHTYSNYGLYNIMFTVTDDDGVTDTDTTIVYINRGDPPTLRLLYPTDNEILNGTVTIQWYAHDAENDGNLSIYIYFRDITTSAWSDFASNPYTNDGVCQWDTTTLPDGTYKLLIQTKDSDGNTAVNLSAFQIKNHEEPLDNDPPVKPDTPSGQNKGKAGQEYAYFTNTTDPDGDLVYYQWDWGDGNYSGWLGPYGSGVIAGKTHEWSAKGSYSIKVKAKDMYGVQSPWSDSLLITMPYIYQSPSIRLFEWLFEWFLYASRYYDTS